MKYTSNFNRRGKVERVLDLIWDIITIKGAVTAVVSYCGEKLGEAKERNAERRNEVKANSAIVAAVAVSIVVGICTGLVVTNSQANSRKAEARARAAEATKEIKERMGEANSILENAIRSYEQRQREREILEGRPLSGQEYREACRELAWNIDRSFESAKLQAQLDYGW